MKYPLKVLIVTIAKAEDAVLVVSIPSLSFNADFINLGRLAAGGGYRANARNLPTVQELSEIVIVPSCFYTLILHAKFCGLFFLEQIQGEMT